MGRLWITLSFRLLGTLCGCQRWRPSPNFSHHVLQAPGPREGTASPAPSGLLCPGTKESPSLRETPAIPETELLTASRTQRKTKSAKRQQENHGVHVPRSPPTPQRVFEPDLISAEISAIHASYAGPGRTSSAPLALPETALCCLQAHPVSRDASTALPAGPSPGIMPRCQCLHWKPLGKDVRPGKGGQGGKLSGWPWWVCAGECVPCREPISAPTE